MICAEASFEKKLGGGRGAFCIEMYFYADISWESRCNSEINPNWHEGGHLSFLDQILSAEFLSKNF